MESGKGFLGGLFAFSGRVLKTTRRRPAACTELIRGKYNNRAGGGLLRDYTTRDIRVKGERLAMSSTTLKLIALVLMFFDHVYSFIGGAPIWLKWIGRISAPLFVFTMVWGLYYTHDRKKYLKNMYFWGVGMSVGDVLTTVLVPNAHASPSNNIFVTLFLIGFIIVMIEQFSQKKFRSGIVMLAALLAMQALSFLLIPPTQRLIPGLPVVSLVCIAVFPNLLYCEGMFFMVIVGVALYFSKRLPPVAFSLIYIALSALMTLGRPISFTTEGLLYDNYQWMMAAALPFLLAYNGKKGRNIKWLFYVFYPAHIFLLCWIGSFFSF